MTNYYEKLNLDSNSSAKELTEEIEKLERTWLQRIIQQPEKAQEMLSLISEAKPFFGSEEAKAEYDKSLFSRGSEADEKYVKALNIVHVFVGTEQWDLAKNAVCEAISISDAIDLDTDEKVKLYNTAIDINLKNEQFKEALEYSNRVLAIYPEDAQAYCRKAEVLRACISESTETSKLKQTYKVTCKAWVACARKGGASKLLSDGLAELAGIYFNEGNYESAQKCVLEALSVDSENPKATGISNMLSDTDTYRAIHLDEFVNYKNEKLYFEEEIKSEISVVCEKLRANNIYSMDLCNKHGYFENGSGTKETYEYRIVLLADGYLEEISSTNNKESLPNPVEYKDVLIEFDFDANYRWELGGAFHNYYRCYTVLSYAPEARSGCGDINVRRIGCYKGFGLYKCLKEVPHKIDLQEEERKRKEAEAEAKRKAVEEERKRREVETVAKRKAEEEERKQREAELLTVMATVCKRKEAEAEAKHKADEEEHKRREAEAVARCKAKEEERKQREAEENERTYNKAKKLMAEGNLSYAKQCFDRISGYKDSDKLSAEVTEKIRRQSRIDQGRCQYCGGEFHGLFTKKCVNCGKKKDY